MPMSCCPPTAEGFLASDYVTKGTTLVLHGGTEVYASGNTKTCQKGVVVIPDVFGWNAGRTRNVADWLAEEGFYTVVPKLLVPALEGGTDGDGLPPDFSFANPDDAARGRGFIKDVTNWQVGLKPKILDVIAHIESVGISKVSLLGFCWGGYIGSLILSDPDTESKFLCLAIGHPSLSIEERIFGRDVLELVKRIQKPVLFMPAKDDPAEYREDGVWFLTLKERFPTSETLDFPEVNHGFIPRGDISIPAVEKSVKAALAKTLEFFAAHN